MTSLSPLLERIQGGNNGTRCVGHISTSQANTRGYQIKWTVAVSIQSYFHYGMVDVVHCKCKPHQLERVGIASKVNGSTKYLSQLKSYLRGGNDNLKYLYIGGDLYHSIVKQQISVGVGGIHLSWHFHKSSNTRSWAENECCCPCTVNMSNIDLITNTSTPPEPVCTNMGQQMSVPDSSNG